LAQYIEQYFANIVYHIGPIFCQYRLLAGNLFGDGNDGEKESLLTTSDVRDLATKPASEESEPVSLRTRSKLVVDDGDVEHAPGDDSDADANDEEDEQDTADPATSRHRSLGISCRKKKKHHG